jgi:hypothetical protein
MDNWLFIFTANIIGGIIVFYSLMFLFSLTGSTIDSAFFIGIFLFIQLSFVTTLLFYLLHKLKMLERETAKTKDT